MPTAPLSNAHRQHYKPEAEQAPSNALTLVAVMMLAACGTIGMGAFFALMLHGGAPIVTPVRTPDVQVFPVEPIDRVRVQEIRTEAFSAGLQEGLSQACGTSPLSAPIASR
jgi:hypothetical protein